MKRILHFAALLLLSATLVVVVGSPTIAMAKGKGSPKKKATPFPVSTSDKITAVHLTSVTVNVFANQKAQEFKVTPATKITINSIDGKLSGLTTGMDVVVTPSATDPTTADKIEAKTPRH